ncbi:TBC1 domain member 31 [Clydaea vesicula]|uniref:TBC1 domain member 31 n=1 Tax=Clydaea vesicula TaxID=447962 RepID=A0AAD5U4B0_9FUNG|nr:TBC1 domain member 31 [Clydaea vesicula]
MNLEKSKKSIYLSDSKSGKIWETLTWKKITQGKCRKGILLKIYNANFDSYKIDNLISTRKQVSFSNLCFSDFNFENNSNFNYLLGLVDDRGHIFKVDFPNNKYELVARAGIPAKFIIFNSIRKREVIVALADKSIHCYNFDSGNLIAKLTGYHKSNITFISCHPSENLCITTSKTEAIVWNTENWSRSRLLLGASNALVQQARFSNNGEYIVTSFDDFTIYIWQSDFSLLWKFEIDEQMKNKFEAETSVSGSNFYCQACSNSGEFLAYGGLTSTVLIWNLLEKVLITEILAVLSESGMMIFLDVVEGKQIAEISGSHYFKCFSISPDGSVISLIYLDQKFLTSILRLDTILNPALAQIESDEEDLDFENTSMKDGNFETISYSKPKKVELVQPNKTFFELIESKKETSEFNKKKLKKFLKQFGGFPSEHRVLIWRYLLKLPENRQSYEALVTKPNHPTFNDFRKKYPIKSDRLAKAMERILPINIANLISKAYEISFTTPSELLCGRGFNKNFKPLSEGTYPVFNEYPTYIVNFRSQMREKIRKEELEYLRRRKIAGEVTRLSEELKKDKKAWEAADWKTSDMIDKWWAATMDEEALRQERNIAMNAAEKEKRAAAMDVIAEARKSFLMQSLNNKSHQLNTIEKSIGLNEQNLNELQELEDLNSKFQEIEDEWSQRKEEMIRSRERLVYKESERIKSLVENISSVGINNEVKGSNAAIKPNFVNENIATGEENDFISSAAESFRKKNVAFHDIINNN